MHQLLRKTSADCPAAPSVDEGWLFQNTWGFVSRCPVNPTLRSLVLIPLTIPCAHEGAHWLNPMVSPLASWFPPGWEKSSPRPQTPMPTTPRACVVLRWAHLYGTCPFFLVSASLDSATITLPSASSPLLMWVASLSSLPAQAMQDQWDLISHASVGYALILPHWRPVVVSLADAPLSCVEKLPPSSPLGTPAPASPPSP